MLAFRCKGLLFFYHLVLFSSCSDGDFDYGEGHVNNNDFAAHGWFYSGFILHDFWVPTIDFR